MATTSAVLDLPADARLVGCETKVRWTDLDNQRQAAEHYRSLIVDAARQGIP